MYHRTARFGMGLFISLCFILMINLGIGLNIAAGAEYIDINNSNADQSYIKYLSQKGIIKGYPDGSFKPQEGLTRAQGAVVLAKAANLALEPNAANSFKDVKANHWASVYISAAVKAGYMSGYPDGTFKPDQRLSRAEGISLLLRLSKQPQNAILPKLNDINNQHWAAPAVAVGLASGMVGLSADGQNYFPNAAFTRINMAHALGILLTEDPVLSAGRLPGQLKPVQGKITIIKAGSQTEEDLQTITTVNPGDSIITTKGGSAELSYPDGSSLLIKEDTCISIKAAQGRKYIKTNGQEGIAVDWLNLDMKQGTIFTALATKHEIPDSTKPTADTKSSNIKEKNIAGLNGVEYISAATGSSEQAMPWYEASKTKKVKVKVDMPWGVAAVRGTFVMISVAPSGQASVSCLTGTAEVTNGGQTVPLGQNQCTQVTTQTAAPPPPAPMPPAAIQQFAQVQTWIQQTAQTMDQNQELATPPPVAINLPVQAPALPVPTQTQMTTQVNQTVTGQSPATTSLGSAMQVVSQALGSIGISAGSTTPSSPSSSSSRSGETATSVATENSLGQNVPVISGSPMNFAGGIKINLGNNSIPTGATVKVDSLTAGQLAMGDLQAGGPILSFQFASMSINQPVEISLPVNTGADVNKAGIYYYNNRTWEYQNSLLENGMLKATVNHFSIYGVLIDNTAPTDLNLQSGAITANSIELNFSGHDRTGIKNYVIYRNGEKIAATSTNQYIDTGLSSDQTYNYQIQATDRFNNQSELSQYLNCQTTAGINDNPEPEAEPQPEPPPVQINAELLIQSNHYSLPVPGSQAGTCRMNSLNLTGIAGASQWQIKVGSSSFPVPELNSIVSGAVYYATGLDIAVVANDHLLLLATDNTNKVQAYADITIDASMIYISPVSAPQLILGTHYSNPVPGSSNGKTKIANLNLGSFAPAATQWKIKLGSSSFPIPELNSTVSGAVYYAAGTDTAVTANDHLLLMATDNADRVQAYADIQILYGQIYRDQLSWVWRNPLPTGDDLTSIAYGDGQWLAVGNGGNILTSNNGTSWIVQTTGTSRYLSKVAWNGSQWVVVGTEGTILSSSNGSSWVEQISGSTTDLEDVAWNGNQWVAVGYNGVILTSDNGSSWTLQTTGVTNRLCKVAWNGSQWITVGWYGAILTSVDGNTWVVQSAGPTKYDFEDVAWNGNLWMAVGGDGAILTSSSGSSWVKQSAGTTNNLFCVDWNGSQWVVAGLGTTILTSSDGSSWGKQNPGPGCLKRVSWNGSQWVAVGAVGTIMTSSNGNSWNVQNSGTMADLEDVAWIGGQWVAVGAVGTIMTSSDGINWAMQNTRITASDLRQINWNGSQWVAVGGVGTIVTSSNGNSWAVQNSGTTNFLNDVVWNGGQWVAVGVYGNILTSSNGINWSIQNAGTTKSLNKVAWNGSLWVAVGDSIIVTSSNGSSWAVQNSGSVNFLNDVVWNGSQWVAVGDGGTILTSIDGSSWVVQNAGTENVLNHVAWNGSQWVVVGIGDGGTILTSSNGSSWVKQNSGNANILNDVVWNGSQWVVVGNVGTILTSIDGNSWVKQNVGTSEFFNEVAWNGSQWVVVGYAGTIWTSSDGTNWCLHESGTSRGLCGIGWDGNEWLVVGDYGTVIQSSP